MATKTPHRLFEQADLVYSYTRAQALQDGELVDVSETAQEAGIRFPCAVTRHVWGQVVDPDRFALAHGESVQGRLWDVLWMFRLAAKTSKGDTLRFQLSATVGGHPRIHRLWARCGPGDTPAPVVTIMAEGED